MSQELVTTGESINLISSLAILQVWRQFDSIKVVWQLLDLWCQGTWLLRLRRAVCRLDIGMRSARS